MTQTIPNVTFVFREGDEEPETDPVEEAANHIPVVIPVVGAVLIFLLAFIAITMA